MAVFTFIESRAPAYGPIHESLAFYMLLLATLPCTASLLAMLDNYICMRIRETMLSRYLIKLGVQN